MTGLYGMSGGIGMKISKNKIMITAIIVLCVAVAVLAAVLVIRKDKNKDNDDKFTPTIDSDSGEIGTGSNYSGGQQGIRIPGYPSITVDAGKDNVTMNLFNPEGNPCYFTFEIVLSDTGETIYKSDMVEPGKAITNVKLQHPLATGEHNAVIKISTASLTDGKTMNGANVEKHSLMDERMEAIMRKLTAMALSMMFILESIIPVGAEETQTRQTKISVSIDPVYTVTIPANTTIERGEQSVKLGSVSLDNARLEPDKNVNVSVSASGKLKNSKDESKTIAYKIMDGNKEFSTATYAESGNSTNLTLSIDKSEWDKAYAGSYSDTLVFTISYR